jgi:hypothetical protein
MSFEDTTLIAECARGLPGIAELHLPQVFIETVMDKPRQVLVVVLSDLGDVTEVLNQLGNRLQQLLPIECHLDLWPIAFGTSIVNIVRNAKCQVAIPID